MASATTARRSSSYVDINAPNWGVSVQSQGRERGFQSFAFHPQFGQPGMRGYGKFYTYTDSSNMQPKPDFVPAGGMNTHDTVLLEWTAKNAAAPTYDGGPPRELLRFRQPFANHNGGLASFNPLAMPGGADYGLLYFTLADGGSGGDPFNAAQNLGTPFGKMLRIDPLGNNSANGKVRHPGRPIRSPATSRSARRDLRVRRPQPAALWLGSEGWPSLPLRDRPEHRRGARRRDGRARISGGTTGRRASASWIARTSTSISGARIRR